MKEVSEITSVNYATVRKIISNFKNDKYTMNHPKKKGRKNKL